MLRYLKTARFTVHVRTMRLQQKNYNMCNIIQEVKNIETQFFLMLQKVYSFDVNIKYTYCKEKSNTMTNFINRSK